MNSLPPKRSQNSQISAYTRFVLPSKLIDLGESKLKALADFTTQSSKVPDTQTVAITSLVMSFWQSANRNTVPRFPSLLLVRNNTNNDDPVDSSIKSITMDWEYWKPAVQKQGHYIAGSIKGAPSRMKTCIQDHEKIDPQSEFDQQRLAQLEQHFHAAQRTGFGHGRFRPYSQAWHREFGFLSGTDDSVILRLESSNDIKLLHDHLRSEEPLLENGTGIGKGLRSKSKAIALSGSLREKDWDKISASRMTNLGRPLIALPHSTEAPLTVPNKQALSYLCTLWNRAKPSPVAAPTVLPGSEFCQSYLSHLRQLLFHLPASYDFAIQRMVRELFSVCLEVTKLAASEEEFELNEPNALMWDLYHHTFRGILIGLESLKWHRLGARPDKDLDLLNKVLTLVRKNKTISLRDIQRKARLKSAAQRDQLIAKLNSEGLIQIEGKKVNATSFSDFTRTLYTDPRFVRPLSCWELLKKQNTAKTRED